MHANSPPAKNQIIPISSLLGRSRSNTEEEANQTVVLLGMLSQITENEWYLEDPSGHITVDLSGAARTTGMFTESCIVLAEGTYVDGMFRARMLGQPPQEKSIETR